MRSTNSIRNVAASLIGQVLGTLSSFISRTIFIMILGTEYLGLNGLFTNILSILSLAELGVGSAIIYSLYKPLAINDTNKIEELMNFYKDTYRIIALIIFILGISIIPFLPNIIVDMPPIDNISFIYFLFLINTVLSYLFSYKKSLITADQKGYIITIYSYAFYIAMNIIQVIILIITKNYILFLLVQVAKTILENLTIANKANKMYPMLKNRNKAKLDKASKKEIGKNVKAMLCHKIGGIVVSGTDNIIISSALGVVLVGLYSNYCLIINAISLIVTQIFNAITASIGNLNAQESKEKSYQVFKNILFINFWISNFSSVTLFILLNIFIELWIGKEYLFSNSVTLLIVINFYMATSRLTAKVYKDSIGLFWNDRYKPIIEAIINIIASVLLVRIIGIAGVFLGTFISTITTTFWVEPYVLYKNGFNKNPKIYFIKWIKYTMTTILSGVITYKICLIFSDITWFSLFIKLLVCLMIPNILYAIIFRKSDEIKYVKQIIIGIGDCIIKKDRYLKTVK